jgi:hypothetical protein
MEREFGFLDNDEEFSRTYDAIVSAERERQLAPQMLRIWRAVQAAIKARGGRIDWIDEYDPDTSAEIVQKEARQLGYREAKADKQTFLRAWRRFRKDHWSSLKSPL